MCKNVGQFYNIDLQIIDNQLFSHPIHHFILLSLFSFRHIIFKGKGKENQDDK